MNSAWAGLPDENVNEKPNTAKKRPEKGQTDCLKAGKKQTVFLVLPCLCHKKTFKLQQCQKNYLKLKLNLAWQCIGAHYWCFSDFSWFVRMHTLGKTVRQFVSWSIGSFLHPYKSHLAFTPVLTTRIITTLPLLNVFVAFLSRRRRPVCKRWACLACTTQYTVQRVHAFPVVRPMHSIAKSEPRASA